MKAPTLIWLLIALTSVAFGGALAASPTAQDDDGPTLIVPDDDLRARLEARQSRARELMAELEDRMFQLSELLRGDHPDDAARLVLGLRKAREELILEDMQEIEAHLLAGRYGQAAEGQRGVIRRLAELRDLLLSTDLDLLLKLERLRKLTTALSDLDALQAEQAELQERTEAMNQQEADSEERARAAKGAEMAQAEAKEQAQDLEAEMRESAGEESEAAEAMQEASEAMQRAEQELSENEPAKASESQSKAQEDMQRAKEKLRKDREDLLWELQPHIRRQVIDSLTRIRDQLEKVNEGIGGVLKDSEFPVDLDPERAGNWLDRMRVVGDIALDTQDLVRETEYSVYLDDLLDWSELRLRPLSRGLATEEVGPVELSGSLRVHDLVSEMLEALLEEDRRQRSARGDERTQRIVKLVSELKGVRALQRVLREDTAQMHLGVPGGGLAAATPAELAHLGRLESEVSVMLLDLDGRYMAELVGSDD